MEPETELEENKGSRVRRRTLQRAPQWKVLFRKRSARAVGLSIAFLCIVVDHSVKHSGGKTTILVLASIAQSFETESEAFDFEG